MFVKQVFDNMPSLADDEMNVLQVQVQEKFSQNIFVKKVHSFFKPREFFTKQFCEKSSGLL